MTRTLIIAAVFGTMTLTVSVAAAAKRPAEPPPAELPAETAVTTSPDVEFVQVSNRRFRRGYRYPAYGNRYDYRPYRYSYRPYRGYYYPRYYGTPRFGYYDYGYGRGSVRAGPVRVWW